MEKIIIWKILILKGLLVFARSFNYGPAGGCILKAFRDGEVQETPGTFCCWI